ncbi:MAG: hypothetical protein JXQ83_11255 [Candidatus Glassbacteria bacterium]|nr:hypothetical protein [Candidatus Glassbacteria bacterium]
MSGANKTVLTRCLWAALALSMAAAGGRAAQERKTASGAALERALAELGLEPGEVAAFPVAAQAPAGPVKQSSPGLRLSSLGLAGTLLLLEQAATRLDSLSETVDFLAFRLEEGQPGETGIPAIGKDPAPAAPGRESVEAPAPAGPADSLEALVPGMGEALRSLAAADSLLQRAFGRLEPAETGELSDLLQGFRPEEDQWPDYPVGRMIGLVSRVDAQALERSGMLVARVAAILRRLGETAALGSLPPLRLDTPQGPVVVGGPGNDSYSGTFFLLLDPGGNDTYELGGVRHGVSLVVDCAGDDRYSAADSFSLGAALCGVAWLEDLSGSDSYLGGSFSAGAAALGVGVLVDRGGDDTYRGMSFCQGAALFGLGLLLDLAGRDSYRLDFCGQGAAVGPGRAVLADLAGEDSYLAAGAVPDWREPGATKSWAQGAALGLRPFAPGGFALLYDREGDDRYSLEYFGQGAGYWEGAGLLADRGGNDSYRAARYAQGCGVHRAAGLLADSRGDDSYEVGSVGQGAGEDRALGVLLESGGRDTYRAGWMARGAGGSGGVGLLLELAGDDSYFRARKASDGFGGRWKELASLGFLVDCDGEDNYEGLLQNCAVRRSGTWGAALDLPLENHRR